MATAVRKPSPTPPADPNGPSRSLGAQILGVFDRLYGFLASLKLAVISLVTLAAVLGYATFFESWYGATAAREWIYQSKGFALLLALLGANILCAALIRFPWKTRQIGFVITHTGLLILLAGSYISSRTADEGQVGMLEGQTMNELVRRDASAIRVRKIDPNTGRVDREFGEYVLPFTPGTFAWGPDRPKARTVFGEIAHAVTFGALDDKRGPEELLTRPDDPFKLVLKAHIPASRRTFKHEPDPENGVPMLALRPRIKGPAMPRFQDVFDTEEERWFTTDSRFQRAARSHFPARFVFQYADRADIVDDFLNPPEAKGPEGVARFRYVDKAGKTRIYDWPITEETGKAIALPDSDIHVVYAKHAELPATELPVRVGDREVSLARLLGEPVVPLAQFQVRQGEGPASDYYGWGSLPSVPNLIPSHDAGAHGHGDAIVRIHYYVPPILSPKGGLMGQVEVLGTKDGALYYRAFGRGEPGSEIGRLRGKPGPIKTGEEVAAFGGEKTSTMTMTLEVERYLPAGREEEVCVPVELPKGQKDNGIAASQVAMTVGGATKTLWLSRSATLDKRWETVTFPSGDTYEVSYDVDRKPLGFELTLDDFDRLFDPGTEQPSRFVSKVRLTDEKQHIKNRAITIAMNEPLSHRDYTFYQSSYVPEVDPRTERPTGRFISVLQVATDGGRWIKYLGCALVVAGAMVQLLTRTGIFSDGGHRERARAAARAARHAGTNGTHYDPNMMVTDVTEAEETL